MTSGSERLKGSTFRSGGLALWMIALFALLIRWVHLFIVKDTDLVQIQIIDAAFYHSWAVAISNGEIIGNHTFFMSPLYSYLAGLVYAIIGAAPVRLMALQGLMGVGTVLLVFRWGSLLAGRTVGLVAAALTAVYAPFIFYETTLLTSTLILLLGVVILNLTEAVLRKTSTLNLLLLGGVIGLSALARPLVLIFVPLLFLVLIIDNRDTWIKRSIWLTVGVLILLIPVGIRNLAVGGDFTLTTSSAGMNFYVGNNPEATGLYWEAPFLTSIEPQYEDEDYRRVASKAVERELSTREAGQYWFNRSLDWMIHAPLSYLKLLGRKIFYFWNRAEFANNVSIYYGKEVSPIIAYNPFGFWLIGPLGLAGLILLWRRLGWKRARVPVLWVFAYFAGCVIFFVASEYRLAAVPALIVGVAYLLVEIYNYLKAHRVEPAMRLLALGLLFMPLSNLRTDFIYSGENPRMDYFNFGNTLLKQDKSFEAISRFQRSLAIDPYFAEGMMRLAEAYSRAGMNEQAIEIGKRVGLENPESIIEIVQAQALQEAYALLGEGKFNDAMDEFAFAGLDDNEASAETTRVHQINDAQAALKDGRPERALKMLKQVNANDDSSGTVDPVLLHNIAALSLRMGVLDSAEHYATEVLELDSMNVPAAYLLTRILNASGRWEEAERLIMRVTPDAAGMQDKLNVVRAKMDSLITLKQWNRALEAYGEYGKLGFAMHPEDKVRVGQVQLEIGNLELALKLLTEAEAAGVDDPDLFFHQGRSFSALGRSDEAIAAVQKCLAVEPDHIQARIFLARLYISQNKIKQAWSELEAVSHFEIIDPELAEEYGGLVDSLKAL